jgi:predicted helicase
MWIAERLKAKSVVIFLPSLALIHQTALEWAKATSKTLKLMAVCSDNTVALDEDEIVVDKNEFWFPVLSEPREIKKFLEEPINNKEMKVVFCTYQSSFTLAEAVGNFKFALLVADEAHRTAVKGDSYFSAPLFDEYIPADKRLFVTATPKQYSLAKKNNQDDFAAVLSMDNEEIYGKHCHVLSFRKAIEQGIISDYKIIFPEITSDIVAKEMKLREGRDLPEDAIYYAAMQIALKKAVQTTKTSKIITFHARVKEAEQFAHSLQQTKILQGHRVFHVNGKQASATRKAIMRKASKSTGYFQNNGQIAKETMNKNLF